MNAELKTKFVYSPIGGVDIELDDTLTAEISLGSEVKNNNAKITLKNPPLSLYTDGDLRYKYMDNDKTILFKGAKIADGSVIDEELIKIYAHYTQDPTLDVETDDYLLFTGIISKAGIKTQESEGIDHV